MRAAPNTNAVFQPIKETARITGLSTKHIRAGCKAGEIPHIRVGTDYRINLPLYLEQLNAASMGGAALG